MAQQASKRRQMTETEAYREYREYLNTCVPTKTDPLRTFSGWLVKFNVEIVDLEESEANDGPSQE